MNSSTSSFRVWHIIAYVAALWLLCMAVQWMMMAGIRANRTGEFAKLRHMFMEANDYETLFLGSSRAESGLMPDVFDSILQTRSYNIALTGADPLQMEVLLEAWLVHSKMPEVLVLSVDVHQLDRPSPLYNSIRFMPYLKNPVLRQRLPEWDGRLVRGHRLAPYGLTLLGDRYLYAAIRGWTGQSIAFDRSYSQGYVPVPAPGPVGPYTDTLQVSIIPEQLAALERMLKAHGSRTRIVIILGPLPAGRLSTLEGLEGIRSLIGHLAAEYEVPVLDFVEDSTLTGNEWYIDFNHLNGQGARLWTEKVARQFPYE